MLDEEEKNSCETKPRVHRINVFHIDTSYMFFTVNCENCKKQSECKNEKHKSDTCKIAICADKLLMRFVQGKVISFRTHDFYIRALKKRDTKQQFYVMLARLRKKFVIKPNVKE